MTKNNCKDCQKRKPGCHAACETYLKFRKELDEINKKRRQEQLEDSSHYRDGWQFRRKKV